MSAPEVKVRFSAVDKLSEAIRGINQELQSIRSPAVQVTGRFAKLGQTLNASGIKQAFAGVTESARALHSELSSAVLAASGLGAIVIGGGFGLVKAFAGAADNIAETAEKLGIGTDALQVFRFAAQQVGVEQGQLDTGLRKLGQNLALAAAGGGEAAPVFRALGIEAKGADGKIRTLEDVLPELADKFSKIESASARNALAVKIFGREGAGMGVLLSKGAAGLEQMRQEAQALGGVLDAETVKSAGDFNDEIDKILFAVKGAGFAIAAELLPSFQQLGKEIVEFLRSNREEIKAFGQTFKIVLDATLSVAKVVFSGIAAAVKAFSLLPVSAQTGILYAALAALAAVIAGPVVAASWQFVASSGAMLKVLGGVFMTLLKMTPLYQGFAYALAIGAKPLQAVVFGFQTLGVAILGAAKSALVFLATNPLGWLILAGTAIAGVIIYWDEITAFFSALPEKIVGAWQFVKDWFSTLWNDPMEALSNFVKFVIEKLSPLGSIVGGLMSIAAPEANVSVNGAPAGNDQAVAAINGAVATSRSESKLTIDMSNVPRGTVVQPGQNNELPINLNLGYAGVFR